MSTLRVMKFERPHEFARAIADYDDYSMNFALGSLLDYGDKSQVLSQARWGAPMGALLAVYREDELLLTLTKHAKNFSWVMASPSHVDPSLEGDASDIDAAATLIAETLPTVVNPHLMDKVLGPERAVNAFIESWVAFMVKRGVQLKTPDSYFHSRACCATLSTLPPSSMVHDYPVSLARLSDVDTLIPLFVEFSSHGPNPVSPETARNIIREGVEARRLWAYRIREGLAGYVLVGRETRRTIAIRNVFVLSQYRRKGIAEAMVRTVTRYYLGAETPNEMARAGESAVIAKHEICLNVGDPAVMRIYSRCGFMLDNNARNLDTEKRGWFATIWRGVEPM
ncbi:predicted protein [Postia placenta Mad-698-R]|nr:predicted protein [Postia placenta Mad-698-R]